MTKPARQTSDEGFSLVEVLISVAIMIFGVALFLRLIQTIFRPQKVHHRCPDCGLSRHDPDAVHCKHCGRTINIPTEGEW